MIELRVPQHLISRIIGEDGLINFLPVIPPEDVLLGVDFIRERAMEEDHTAKLDIFWRYFRKTWMKRSTNYKDAGNHNPNYTHIYILTHTIYAHIYTHTRSYTYRHWRVPDVVLEYLPPDPRRRQPDGDRRRIGRHDQSHKQPP